MKGKSTKSALLMSFTSLLLCFAMLIGCTFAWFTDSVTSGVNKIVAGNLDIEVSYKNDNTTSDWTPLEGSRTVFSKGLWEPGHTEFVTLKVENKGTLALNYKVLVTPVTEKGGVNVSGQSFKLSDYLVFGTTNADTTEPHYTRETARGAVGETTTLSLASLTKTGTMAADADEQYITLVVYMPESVGNDANYKTGTAAPEIELGITVLATQMQAETDSFDTTYDAGAVESNFNGVGPVYDYFPQTVASQVIPENITAPVTVTASGKLNKDDAAPTTLAEVTVPIGAIADGAKEITVSVKPVAATNQAAAAIVASPGEGREAVNFDIHVDGIKDTNEMPENTEITVTVFVGKGLSGVQVYHTGTLIEGATYDANTGYITFNTTSFSDYTVAYDAAVAAIGTQTYGSLALAIAAVKDNEENEENEEVVLLKDMTLTKAIVIPDGKTIIFNGNGKTVTVTVDPDKGKAAFGNEAVSTEGLKGSAKLTVKNTNFVSSAKGNTYAVITGSGFAGSVTMQNCSFKNMHTAVYMNSNGETAANLSITNCAYSNTSWGYSVDNVTGTANVDVDFIGNSGIGADKEFEVFPGKVAVIKSANALPKQFSTLKDAIAAVTNGQTIELLADLTVGDDDIMTSNDAAFGIFNFDQLHSSPSSLNLGDSVTLDGKEHTITVSSGMTGNSNGRLNSVFNVVGNLTVNFKNLTVNASNFSYEYGNNKTKAVHVFNAAYSSLPQGATAGTVTFENCTAINGTGYGLVVNNFTATVDGLTTSGNGWGGINVDRPSANATINSANCAEDTGVNAEGGRTTISGGQYKAVGVPEGKTAQLTITGGTFSTDPSAYVAYPYEAVESGGVWKVQPDTANYVFDGVEFIEGNNEKCYEIRSVWGNPDKKVKIERRLITLEVTDATQADTTNQCFTVKCGGTELECSGEDLRDIVGDNTGRAKGMQDGDVILLPAGDVYVEGTSGDPCSFYNTTLVGAESGTILHVTSNGYRSLRVYQRASTTASVFANFYRLTVDGSAATQADSGAHFLYTTAYNATVGMKNVTVQNYGGYLISQWGAESLDDESYPQKSDNCGVDVYLRDVDAACAKGIYDFDLMPYVGGGTGNQAGWSYGAISFDNDCQFSNSTAELRSGRVTGAKNAFVNGELIDAAKPAAN